MFLGQIGRDQSRDPRQIVARIVVLIERLAAVLLGTTLPSLTSARTILRLKRECRLQVMKDQLLYD
jgi:hypothetical protein